MKEQDKIKTKEDVIEFIECYISWRGGMYNRIDAGDILDMLKGRNRVTYKRILRFISKMKIQRRGEDDNTNV